VATIKAEAFCMSYIDANLIPGEEVVYQTRLHWIVMLGHILFALFVLGAPGGILLFYAKKEQTETPSQDVHVMLVGAGVLLASSVVVIIAGLVRRNATEMAVTTRRVVIKTGLASRKTIEMLLNKVESVEVRETASGRILGYGTIVLIGTGGTSEPFYKIAHPLEFRSRVQQQIEKLPLPAGVVRTDGRAGTV
jgi:uncharacterized membrane protein YdbT with pleckstrin-like domain